MHCTLKFPLDIGGTMYRGLSLNKVSGWMSVLCRNKWFENFGSNESKRRIQLSLVIGTALQLFILNNRRPQYWHRANSVCFLPNTEKLDYWSLVNFLLLLQNTLTFSCLTYTKLYVLVVIQGKSMLFSLFGPISWIR